MPPPPTPPHHQQFVTPTNPHKFSWGPEGTPRRSKRAKTTGRVNTSATLHSGQAATRQSRALEILKHSNAVLERLLAERREHEALMESKLHEAQQHLKRSKDRALRETVKTLSSLLFMLVVGCLLWGMYKMFSPHFDSIIMAGLVALLLRGSPQAKLHRLVTRWQQALHHNVHRSTALGVLSLALGLLFGVNWQCQVALLLAVCLQAACAWMNPHALVAAALTVIVSAGLCFPLLFVLHRCAVEVDSVVKLTMHLLESPRELESVTLQVLKFPPAQLAVKAMDAAGMSQLSVDVVGAKVKALGAANSQLALEALANMSNLTWACGVFASTLFWMLQLDLGSIWDTTLGNLSPLLPQDNVDMHFTLRQSTLEVFLGSASVGLTHALVTFGTLTLVGSPLAVLPAFLSCCLAVAPMLGSFVVWLPFVLALCALDRIAAAALVAGLELATTLVLEPWLVSRFPTSGKFFGLPIVCGLFAFGPFGFVYGPLVIGLSMTTAKIFLRYVSSRSAAGGEYEWAGEDGEPDEDDGLGGDGEAEGESCAGFSYMRAQSPGKPSAQYVHASNKSPIRLS